MKQTFQLQLLMDTVILFYFPCCALMFFSVKAIVQMVVNIRLTYSFNAVVLDILI